MFWGCLFLEKNPSCLLAGPGGDPQAGAVRRSPGPAVRPAWGALPAAPRRGQDGGTPRGGGPPASARGAPGIKSN